MAVPPYSNQKLRRRGFGVCAPLSSQCRTVLGASRSRRVAAQTLTRLCAMRLWFANGAHVGRRAKRSSVMSQAQPASNVLLVEVPPQFIALCHARGHPARPRRHALRPALRRRQPPPATRRPRVPLTRLMGPFAGPSSPWKYHSFNREVSHAHRFVSSGIMSDLRFQ